MQTRISTDALQLDEYLCLVLHEPISGANFSANKFFDE